QAYAATAIAAQSDGKILIGAYGLKAPGSGVIRLLPSGALDPSFGDGGIAFVTSGLGNPTVVALQPNDGRIVVAASFRSGTTTNEWSAVRFNTNGSVDQTFSRPSTGGDA